MCVSREGVWELRRAVVLENENPTREMVGNNNICRSALWVFLGPLSVRVRDFGPNGYSEFWAACPDKA